MSTATSVMKVTVCVLFLALLSLPAESEEANQKDEMKRLNLQNTQLDPRTRAYLLQQYAMRRPMDSQQDPDFAAERFGTKRYRGQGGWTLNSVGYNGGLGALRKLFNKRDNAGLDGQASADHDLNIATLDKDQIIQDFVQFLELRENGLLGPEMLRCVVEHLQHTPQDI